MPTTFVKGDFLEETPLTDGSRAFAFGADISGSMDAGIAVAMKRRWPALEAWWAERCSGGRTHPGDTAMWKDGTDVVYALAIGKQGSRAKVPWLDRAVRSMIAQATKEKVTRISVPRLWGGETGLQGDRAKRVLSEVGERAPVVLVVFEQFVRAKPGEAAAPEAAPSEVASKKTATKKATAKKTATKKAATPKAKAGATKKVAAKAAEAPKTKKKAAPKAKAGATTKKVATTTKKVAAKKTATKKAATPKARAGATTKKVAAKKAPPKKTKAAPKKTKAKTSKS